MLLADEVATYHPVIGGNPYQPHMARIVRIYKMVDNSHLFTLRFMEDHLAHSFRHQPGQFIMLSVPGAGEMPISISSSPSRPEVLELCVRRVGRVTDRKSTRLNSSHLVISYAVFCLKKWEISSGGPRASPSVAGALRACPASMPAGQSLSRSSVSQSLFFFYIRSRNPITPLPPPNGRSEH